MPPALPPGEPSTAAAATGWDVSLLGGLRATRGTLTLTQFGSRAVAALLARLALYPQREHPREELIELLWPGVAIEVGRNRLRQTLFALRQLLETPEAANGGSALLLADRHGVRVAAGTLGCDALRFEAAARAGRHAEARALYGGELLPGYYDDWVEDERLRLAALFDHVDAAPLPAAQAEPAALTPPSLPTYLTRFFGRDAEGARLRAEVMAHRLVTLLGPGGSGKTRLAVELAVSLAPAAAQGGSSNHPSCFDQLIFAPLVSCASEVQMQDALLAAARLTAPGGDALGALCAGLAGRRVLLVLDNVEQLGTHAQQVALQLLAGLPALHLLVTSRHVLGLDGEREFAVAPLLLPHAGMPLDRLAINPAVALFSDRARAARADFHLSDANRDCVVALVRELEGMPLALELAASRLRSLSCADMLALLRPEGGAAAVAQPRLELLSRAGPRAGGDPRHASMLRVVEWSWQQLAAAPARLLSALTVFEGGFTAAAVQAVCGAALPTPQPLLDELVAQSLVHVSDGGGGSGSGRGMAGDADAIGAEAAPALGGAARFGIYEPIREFAAAQLAPQAAREGRARHRAWLAAWMATLGHRVPLAALRDEMRNLLAALLSAQADGAPADALRLLLALRAGADELALPAQAIDLLEAALADTTDPVLASRAHTLLGRLCLVAGRGEAARRHVDIGLASVPGEPALRARALLAQASVRWRSSRDAAGLEAQLDEALALALHCGDSETEAGVHSLRAYVRHLLHRDTAGGQALNERALALWERAGNAHAVNRIRYNLAVNASHAGRHAEALDRLQQVAQQALRERDWQQLSKALNMQGEALGALRRWPEALAAYRECVRVAWGAGELHALAYGLWNLPRALARARRPEPAARLVGFAGHYWRTHVGQLNADDELDLRHQHRLAAAQIGRAAARLQAQRGQRMSLADAVALALDAGAPAAAARRSPARAAATL